MALLSGWLNYIEGTLTAPDALSGFPIPVRISTSSGLSAKDVSAIFDEIGANWKKVAFQLGESATESYAEMEFWDTGNEIGLFHVHFDLTSGENTFRMYFGNSHADNTTYIKAFTGNPTEYTDSDYYNFYGLHTDPTAAIPDACGTLDGTPSGFSAGDLGSDYALHFSGAQSIAIGQPAYYANWTVEFRFKYSSISTYGAICGRYIHSNGGWSCYLKTGGVIAVMVRNGASNYKEWTGSTLTADTWYSCSLSFTNAFPTLYINGNAVTLTLNGSLSSGSVSSVYAAGLNLTIGRAYIWSSTFYYLNGYMSHFAYRNVSSTTNWQVAITKALQDSLITYSDIQITYTIHDCDLTAGLSLSTSIERQCVKDAVIFASFSLSSIEIGKYETEIQAGMVIGSDIDAHIIETSGALSVGFTMGASISAYKEKSGDLTAGLVIGANNIGNMVWNVELESGLMIDCDYVTPGKTEPVSTFNWTQVQKIYEKVFIPRYYLTLSKSDGSNPVIIPMSSFQATVRSRGYPWEDNFSDIEDLMEKRGSSVTVEIPNAEAWADTISGLGSYALMKIEKSLQTPEGLEYLEMIIESIVKKVSSSYQTSNNSISIYGLFLPKPAPAKTVVLTSLTQKSISDGLKTFTFAEIDLFLRAYDILNTGDDEIVVGEINYTVSHNNEIMTVKENQFYDASDVTKKEKITTTYQVLTSNMAYDPSTGGWTGIGGVSYV